MMWAHYIRWNMHSVGNSVDSWMFECTQSDCVLRVENESKAVGARESVSLADVKYIV